MIGAWVVTLVLLAPNQQLVVMPINPAKPTTINECDQIGAAAIQYAIDISNNGYVDVVYPNGQHRMAKPIGFDCVPSEWFSTEEAE